MCAVSAVSAVHCEGSCVGSAHASIVAAEQRSGWIAKQRYEQELADMRWHGEMEDT